MRLPSGRSANSTARGHKFESESVLKGIFVKKNINSQISLDALSNGLGYVR